MTPRRDEDRSDPLPIPEQTHVWLEIEWNDSHDPRTTQIIIHMTVHDIPAYHYAELGNFGIVGPGEYAYDIVLIGSPLANPLVHDQNLDDPPYLVGRPKYVYAGINGQQGAARATTVAL